MATASRDLDHFEEYFDCHCPGCAASTADSIADSVSSGDGIGRADQQGIATVQSWGSYGDNIDGLLSGMKWASPVLTFSFPETSTAYGRTYAGSPQTDDFGSFTTVQADAVRGILDQFSGVSGLNFSEYSGAAAGEADLRFALSDDPATAYAYYPSSEEEGGDVWMHNGVPSWADHAIYETPEAGNYAYHTLIHEIGHAMGLKHGHSGSGGNSTRMLATWDSMEYSVMTYRSYQNDPLSGGYSNETWGYAQSLMIYDIAALQTMYGIDTTTRAGDTVYSFSTTTGEMFVDGEGQGTPGANRVFRTVWDAGGTDTYDFSNYTTNLRIDLRPGSHTELDSAGTAQRAYLGDGHFARGHVFNALDLGGAGAALIENAYGGAGRDEAFGNAAANLLNGAGGNDTLFGGGGNDELRGAADRDSLHGGTGNDMLIGGDGNDDLQGFLGDDLLLGGTGRDMLIGSDGDDRLMGGSDADRLYGGTGADLLDGGTGNDSMMGGEGNDRLIGGEGFDRMLGEEGNDVLHGDAGRDLLSGGAGADRLYGGDDEDLALGGDGDDLVFGGGQNDRLYGQDGADSLSGGAGNDRLSGDAGNDILSGDEGRDRVYGGGGDDILQGGSDGDVLFGGEGCDVFVLGTGAGADVVRDFELGIDLIDLREDGAQFEDLVVTPGDGYVTVEGLHGSLRLVGIGEEDLSPDDFIQGP